MRGVKNLVFCALAALAVITVCANDIDYVVNPLTGIGYRIVYQSKKWVQAKEVCEQDGGKLAIPRSEGDFAFIQKLVRCMYYPNITGTDYKLLVWLGINNIDHYKVWKNIDGEDINETGYHTWAGRNGDGYSDAPAEPHCAGMDAANPGLRDWWCHRPQPYVCQKTF